MVSPGGRDVGRKTRALEAEILGRKGRKARSRGAFAERENEGECVHETGTWNGTNDGRYVIMTHAYATVYCFVGYLSERCLYTLVFWVCVGLGLGSGSGSGLGFGPCAMA